VQPLAAPNKSPDWLSLAEWQNFAPGLIKLAPSRAGPIELSTAGKH
jgi:hypothetical protein